MGHKYVTSIAPLDNTNLARFPTSLEVIFHYFKYKFTSEDVTEIKMRLLL